MSPAQLAEIRARLEAAPPGPWTGDRLDGTVKYEVLDANGDTVIRGDNGNNDPSYGIVGEGEEFILHAPTDIAALLAEVERLRNVVERARDVIVDASPGNTVLLDDMDAVLAGKTR